MNHYKMLTFLFQFEKDQDVFGLSSLFEHTKEKKRGGDGGDSRGESKRSRRD